MRSTSSKELSASFHFQTVLCYASSCREVEAKWVHDFDDIPSAAEVCVIPKDVGSAKAGLYTLGGPDLKAWKLAVTYHDLVRACSTTKTRITVLVSQTSGGASSEATALYRNGQSLDLGTPFGNSLRDVWAFLEPLEASQDDTVTKEDPAASANIIQVSGGPDKTVKDWVPASAGLIKTDAEGHPSIAVPYEDYSLPVELEVENFNLDNPAPEPTDPTVKFNVGGVTENIFQMSQLQSGGGMLLGYAVVNVTQE